MSFASPFPEVDIPSTSVYDFLFADIDDADLDRVALVDAKSGRQTSYREMIGRIDAFAGALANRGIGVAAIGDSFTRTAFTDEHGNFAIRGLPPGSYLVRAYNSTHGGDEKRVGTGSVVHLDLAHRETIVGRVVDARGFPVEGAAVKRSRTRIEERIQAREPVSIEDQRAWLDGLFRVPALFRELVVAADRFDALILSP